ncbi:MAG: hypothetical protein GAK43_01788 [Stenotrophomonas maltophilia]|nr:MAG: hypothetical protein GAK43_01788 [Stenotrophomonas maltophilia]
MLAGKVDRRQRGAVAIEFAAVFVLFFAVLYGLLGYCIPLLMLQSFNEAASAGARATVALNPAASNYASAMATAADTAVRQRLSWMPSSWYQACSGSSFLQSTSSVSVAQTINGKTQNQTYTQVTVCVSYPYTQKPIVPLLTLPIIGTVPRLPDVLQGKASLLL